VDFEGRSGPVGVNMTAESTGSSGGNRIAAAIHHHTVNKSPLYLSLESAPQQRLDKHKNPNRHLTNVKSDRIK
jgi:hypothetical protein